MKQKPPAFTIENDQMKVMIELISRSPRDLFLSEICRHHLALDRWKKSGRHLEIHSDTDEGVMPGTVTHNRAELERDAFGSARRTLRLINPLTSLEPVYSMAGSLKVLSIGPRTEMELIHLLGVGFNYQNIFALDLISSSPMIDAGDMHKMPYDDQAFDVTISSWVLGYSSDPQLAVDEMVRVTRSGGLVAIGVTYEPGSEDTGSDIVGCNFASAEDFKALIGQKLGTVHFQQSPRPGKKGGVMLIATINH